VDKSAAELEAVRKAEEKAGLLPQAPGAGSHDALHLGMDASDPLARDLASALGAGIDGAPLADPAPVGGAWARLPELLGISEEELRAKYDIPVELNDAVVAYIRFFQTDSREAFTRWLARSGRYLPMMRAVLEKRGLPLDLVYLSMALAVHGRHLAPLRPAHRLLGGRAPRSGEVHRRRCEVPA
jgi:membrane-bound lytic murein transglycosylase D